MDLKLLQIWTELVETKCSLEAQVENLQKDTAKLKELMLDVAFNSYDCENYPRRRYDFDGYGSSSAFRGAQLLKTFFSVEELHAYIDSKVALYGWEVYDPKTMKEGS